MDFIDFFCGIGTIRMGMEQAGHKCVYSVEWDKHKRRIYGIIFGEEPEGQDIRECRAIDLPRADCWCFGAPCQDFSIAGNRAGLEGDRSSLVREVFRLVRETEEEHRPKYLFYENVKGMFSSNKGLDYFQILCEMDELGYDIEWQLLNSKDFGVPHNRERVFTIGHLRGRSTRKIFPIEGENPISCNQVGTIEAINGYDILKRCYSLDGLAPTLNTCGGGNTFAKFLVNNVKCINSKNDNGNEPPQQARVYDTAGHMAALQAEQGGRFNILASRGRYNSEGKIEQQLETRKDNITNTITTVQKDNLLQDGYRIRRLTPKECWRLQGISDTMTNKVIQAGIGDQQMYRGAGDATTVNVIYEIAKRMS